MVDSLHLSLFSFMKFFFFTSFIALLEAILNEVFLFLKKDGLVI